MSFTTTNNWSYSNFLDTILDQGHSFVDFCDINNPEGLMVMRLDIDFDTNLAVQTATTENKRA